MNQRLTSRGEARRHLSCGLEPNQPRSIRLVTLTLFIELRFLCHCASSRQLICTSGSDDQYICHCHTRPRLRLRLRLRSIIIETRSDLGQTQVSRIPSKPAKIMDICCLHQTQTQTQVRTQTLTELITYTRLPYRVHAWDARVHTVEVESLRICPIRALPTTYVHSSPRHRQCTRAKKRRRAFFAAPRACHSKLYALCRRSRTRTDMRAELAIKRHVITGDRAVRDTGMYIPGSAVRYAALVGPVEVIGDIGSI
jgi:hypothetical protein